MAVINLGGNLRTLNDRRILKVQHALNTRRDALNRCSLQYLEMEWWSKRFVLLMWTVTTDERTPPQHTQPMAIKTQPTNHSNMTGKTSCLFNNKPETTIGIESVNVDVVVNVDVGVHVALETTSAAPARTTCYLIESYFLPVLPC